MPPVTEEIKLVKRVSPKLRLMQAVNILTAVSRSYDTAEDKKAARRILLKAANDVIIAVDELEALE